MEADGIFNILNGLFVAVPLAVATLERGARDKIAVGVRFDDDRKSQISHGTIISTPPCSTNRFPGSESAGTRPVQFQPRTGDQGSGRTEGVNFCSLNQAPAWLVLTWNATRSKNR